MNDFSQLTVSQRFDLDGTTYVINRITLEKNERLVIDCMSVAELERRVANLLELLNG